MQNSTFNAPFTGPPSYRGSGAGINGTIQGPQQSAWTIGGMWDPTNTTDGVFGLVASALPATPHAYFPGLVTSGVVRGIVVFDPSIAQNQPAEANAYLAGTPATLVTNGLVGLTSWAKTQTGAIDPIIGAVVIYRSTSAGTGAAAIGQIEFQPSGTVSAPTGWALLPQVVIQDFDDGATTGNGMVVLSARFY